MRFVFILAKSYKFSIFILSRGYGGTADALGLGPSGRNPVGVQIPLPAPLNKQNKKSPLYAVASGGFFIIT